MRIDAHQHFWNYRPDTHAWINDDMHLIQRNFLPQDLQPELERHQLDGSILVQVDQNEEENLFFIELAQQNPFIKGTVGWVDLRADNIEERLAFYKSYPVLKGFRHIVQAETDPYFLQNPAFRRGIAALGKAGYTYDILIYPHQLPAAIELVQAFPDQTFVLDHLAKPYIKQGELDQWASFIEHLAEMPNVHCKVSGMVTEANWKNWEFRNFRPFLDKVTEAFGTKRLLYGSDWPVCLVAASYANVIGICEAYFDSFSAEEKKDVMGRNAVRVYGL
ncbi:amidohydrolase family protein [Haliscomenobacter hydrossis]|uniref:Amidohydrolase 2 n=1 Tax=Haliscomenobacter hydrossis (strain ATCC 27775 / DSM 1100 / LMG 10767 / O) TaxID=760192 RepID=F4L4I2_HALH1|nr:amidohydrolase family protein [Haliscomenobacter hydrossis]AEE51983.1 amidohydrolase 2 [Haliscomenobacter hydrossis DSM 1100]